MREKRGKKIENEPFGFIRFQIHLFYFPRIIDVISVKVEMANGICGKTLSTKQLCPGAMDSKLSRLYVNLNLLISTLTAALFAVMSFPVAMYEI